MNKILAALSIAVGGLGVICEALVAFGVNVTQPEQNAAGRLGSLLLLILGVWSHPSIPIGPTKKEA